MIHGLPKELPTSILSDFDAGNQDAKKDRLLRQCFCDIAPVRRFLRGDKDFLVGVKGSGKSAIFKLLKKGDIEFENKSNLKQIIISVDHTIDYVAARQYVQDAIDSRIKDEDIRFRLVWELYILYRLAHRLLKQNLHIDDETRHLLESITEAFAFGDETPTIVDVISRSDRLIGCKIDDSQSTLPGPDFYVRPRAGAKDSSAARKENELVLNFEQIRSKINSLLRRNDCVAFVLIDNLDEFLAREEYNAQRCAVQGLLACSNDYSNAPFIKIKLFLRTEVFHKVDFERIGGAEKVKPNAVVLQWEPADIRRFIAVRVLHNFICLAVGDSLRFEIRKDDLALVKRHPAWLRRLFGLNGKDDDRRALRVTVNDFISRSLVTLLLPRTVYHFDVKGNIVDGEEFFNFIDVHFCMANSKVTPRAMVIYLDNLIQISDAYYSENGYPPIELNEDGEYPLFLKDHVLEAFGRLQEDMASYISSAVTHPEWKDRIRSLLTSVGNKTKFSFREVRRLIDYDDDDDEAKQLLGFLEHLGVLRCQNKTVHLPDRIYSIPVLLQKNWVVERGASGA